MTVLLPAWLQAGSYNAEIDRFVGSALLTPATALTGRGGVRRVVGTEFQVSATSPATMQVQVGAGMAFVQGAFTGTQGVYTVVNDGTFNLTIAPSNATNSRFDLVILEVLDQAYAGTSNLAQVRVLTGTPSVSPTRPTATGSYIALAQVTVPAGASSIASTNITDLRTFSGALGAPIPVRNVTERDAMPNKYDGLQALMMGNAYEPHIYWSGAWYGTNNRIFNVTSFSTYSGVTDLSGRTVIDRVKIPDPGFQYNLRIDFESEVLGAMIDGIAYSEPTNTSSVTNIVCYGHNVGMNNPQTQRLPIIGVFPAAYTGNRWVTVKFFKNPTWNDPSNGWTNNSFSFRCMLTLIPTRPLGYIANAVTGGVA